MIPSKGSHLELPQLASFLDSKLSAQEEHALVSHLDHCETCRQSLEAAAGSRDWWEDTRACLKERAPSTQTGSNEDFEHDVDERMRRQLSHILAPSDDPRMIGRIGTYEIVGVIGHGGTGIVLKGFDASLDRFVAIKVMAPELSVTGAARQRFTREAQAAAAVTHENVVPIHAVSQFMGHNYIVMQYVPGHSLDRRIRQQGPLAVVETLRIALHVARALASAHDQGLVHRDIKPANILLEEGIDRPIVTDFGLARVASDASLTNSGAVTGTPNYMSPEQASGQRVDARSDLFSLGSVMYAMCVGHPPFRSDTIMGVLRRVSDSRPSSLRDQNPSIPEWLEAFILKLLAKDPNQRFGNARQVAESLSSELAYHQNPTIHPVPCRSWWDNAPRRVGVRRRFKYVALLLTAVVGVGGGVGWMMSRTATVPKQSSVENETSDSARSVTSDRPSDSESGHVLSQYQWSNQWSNDDIASLQDQLARINLSYRENLSTRDAWEKKAKHIHERLLELQQEPLVEVDR